MSFKVILGIALLTSSVSCLSRNASTDRGDKTGSFWGIFSNSFRSITLTLTITLNYTTVLNITTRSSYNLLKQYIISRLSHNLLLCCLRFCYSNLDTVHMELLIYLFRPTTSTLDSLSVFIIVLTW